jgi:hypothetical protein
LVVVLVGEVVLERRVLPPVAPRKAMCLVWGWVSMVRRVVVECVWEEEVIGSRCTGAERNEAAAEMVD